LWATAEDFSGGQACADSVGVQWIGVGYEDLVIGMSGGDPQAERWTTDRGLRVGDPEEALHRLYPDAVLSEQGEHTFALISERTPTAGRVERLRASVYDGVVTGFEVLPYGAGD
jgi:hypothetical protein